ncbi:hypothetical protein Tco_0721657 [Tanacetum coccineum]
MKISWESLVQLRISTAEESINTDGASMPVVIKDKGKAKMDGFEPEQTKTKLQQRQERAGYEAAVRLQEQLDEEERKRIARVHEEASSFNIEEWEDMGSHTLQQLKKLSFDELKNLFEATIRREVPELAVRSSKRDAEEELDQGSSKRQKTSENDELSQEELQQLMIIVPEEGMNVEALQTKYLIIDWEVYTEDSRINDLVKLWSLVQERFNSTDPTEDKEIELWVELKRLFEPDVDDEL